MTGFSQADTYLLEQIRQGNQDGWSQLVQRYQGRLVAFARGQLGNTADAEDAVQETFVSFLTALDGFRRQASMETFLFSILRRKIVDLVRQRGRAARLHPCSLQDSLPSRGHEQRDELAAHVAAADPTASMHARHQEDQALQEEALWEALHESIERLKVSLSFRDLQIFELLFYAQLRNKDIAAQMDMDEKQVALLKHRFIKRMTQRVAQLIPGDSWAGVDESHQDTLLTGVWESHRPSCPKRTTIGKYLLGTLDGPWHDYVDFHIHRLGCKFCRANLDDLDEQTTALQPDSLRKRIFQSTVGFLRRP